MIVRFFQGKPYREPQNAWEFRVTPTCQVTALSERPRRAYQTSDWGSDHAGLKCRFSIPTETAQGAPLVAIRFGSNPEHIQADKKSWNIFLVREFVRLVLKNTKTGNVVTVRPFTFAQHW